jgi:predicted molibdopterin-dependent oxidoreductase YjgC
MAEEMRILMRNYGKIDPLNIDDYLNAEVIDGIREDVIFTYFHFAEAAANQLTNSDVLDPVAGIPEYKVSAARIEKI